MQHYTRPSRKALQLARHFVAVIFIAVFTLVSLEAQAANLVSAARGTISESDSRSQAQAFTTGAHATGFELSGVRLVVFGVTGTPGDDVVTIRENTSSNQPGDVVATLRKPSSIVTHQTGLIEFNNTFSAPPGTILIPSTTYWVHVKYNTSPQWGLNVGITDSTLESRISAGWSVADSRLQRNTADTAWETVSNSPLYMAVEGTVLGSSFPSTERNDARLGLLHVSAETSDGIVQVNVNPSFSRDTERYSGAVDAGRVVLTMTTANTNAISVQVWGMGGRQENVRRTGVAGQWQASVDLWSPRQGFSTSLNHIGMQVLAQDGSTRKHYVLELTRRGLAPRLVSAALVPSRGSKQSVHLEYAPAVYTVNGRRFTRGLRPHGIGKPPASAFTVRANGAALTVADTSIFQNTVELELSETVDHRAQVTVSYRPPNISAHPVQTTEGGLAAAFTNHPVANRIPVTGLGTGGQEGREVHHGVVTVQITGALSGFNDGRATGGRTYGNLNEKEFSFNGVDYSVSGAYTNSNLGTLSFALVGELSQADASRIHLYLGSKRFRLADAEFISILGNTAISWSDHGLSWTSGEMVPMLLVDANRPPYFWGTDPVWDSFFETRAARFRPFNVGDADGDALTFTLEGRDADQFDIDAQTGWITTKPGVAYDYDTEQRSCTNRRGDTFTCYQLVVRATDPSDMSATQNVFLRLLNLEDRVVQNLQVNTPAGTRRELRLSWNRPSADERPRGYQVEWARADSDRTEASCCWVGSKFLSGGSTGTRLTSLDENTWYRVRVRSYFGPDDLQGRAQLGSDDWGPWSSVLYKGTGSANTPALFVDDAEAREGSDSHLVFRVTLRPKSTAQVTVAYATSDSSATQPADYTRTTGTLTFAPGVTRQEVRVPIVDDTTVDAYETMRLTLSSPSGAILADAVAKGVIRNTEAEVGVKATAVTSGPGGNGIWDAGETVEAELRFNAPVTVEGGPPTLGLLLDGTRREAAYAGGSGTDTLTFRHTVVNGGAKRARLAANGVSTHGAIVVDAQGRHVELKFSVAPYVTAVELAADASGDLRWGPGETIEARFTFGEAVTVTGGSPWTELAIDGFAQPLFLAYASGSGSRTLVFSMEVPESATAFTGLALVADSLVANGATLVSAVSGLAADLRHDGTEASAQPESATSDPLTAEFLDVPPSHGNAAFEFRLRFGEALSLSYLTLRDAVLQATHGTVSAVRRVTQGEDREWHVTVVPGAGAGEVTVTLPARACTEAGAVCTEDERGLAEDVTVRVPEQVPSDAAFEVRLKTVPEEHDGSAPAVFEVEFTKEPLGYSYETMRDETLVIRQGGQSLNATRARRLNPPLSDRWEVTVTPVSKADLAVSIGPFSTCTETGAVCAANDEVLANEVSKTIQGPPGLSVADARVDEDSGDPVVFAVTLGRASKHTVTVDYATSDGTGSNAAVAGEDYTETSGTLTFAAGVTEQTVSVPVLDDSHDEGEETFTLTLSNPQGGNAWLRDATATGTIVNTDAMPRAWLARFGRTVAEQVIGAVEGRFSSGRTAGAEMTLAGERIGLSGPGSGSGAGAAPEDDDAREAAAADAEARSRLEAMTTWLRGDSGQGPGSSSGAGGEDGTRAGFKSRAVTGRDLLTGSSFALTAETNAGGTVSLWGRGAVSRFDGREGDLTLDGEVVSAMMGADWVRERWTAGLLLSRSVGEGGYRGPTAEGEVESTLTGLFPYGRYEASDRVTLWGVAGYGAGDLVLTPKGQSAMRTDMELAMGAVGLRGVAVEAPAAGGVELTVKTDALAVRTTSGKTEGLEAAEADVTRVRLGLEGTWLGIEAGGGTLSPRLEVGVRHDGGDAETGLGLDLGGGLAWSHPAAGLSAELSGRGLLTHESRGLRDRGLSGSFAWEPGQGSGRGPKLTLTQTLGGAASGGADALLGRGTMAGLAANDNGPGQAGPGRTTTLRTGGSSCGWVTGLRPSATASPRRPSSASGCRTASGSTRWAGGSTWCRAGRARSSSGSRRQGARPRAPTTTPRRSTGSGSACGPGSERWGGAVDARAGRRRAAAGAPAQAWVTFHSTLPTTWTSSAGRSYARPSPAPSCPPAPPARGSSRTDTPRPVQTPAAHTPARPTPSGAGAATPSRSRAPRHIPRDTHARPAPRRSAATRDGPASSPPHGPPDAAPAPPPTGPASAAAEPCARSETTSRRCAPPCAPCCATASAPAQSA